MFMDKGTESEHIAFLSLWLSRFVFPGNVPDHIGNHVFWIAIYLARGTRLALAPAVLASIYRDMGLLKASMADSTQIKDGSFLSFALWSPLCYIQVWAWERLPILRPKPNFMKCLRPSKLVWIDCQEPNNAHRVAMQFGLDLPGWISWDNISRDIAWYNFTRPLSYDNWLYLPSRLSESDVTARYLEWWRKIVLCPVDDFKNVVKRQRSSRVPRYRPDKLMKLKTGNSHLARLQFGIRFQCDEGSSSQVKHYPAALFQSASTTTGGVGLSSKMKLIVKQEEDTEQKNSSTDRDVPPGFLPKSSEGEGKCLKPSSKHGEDFLHIAGVRITRSMTRSKTDTDKF
ncbi:Hypothetical predicted protein [Olea europaea subsp. europaea]|uniref:Aminotransferase-like plant mobile domain-containing protein n=1 Tax=Olea europaea subsp. europaea TaxID=158383 RepID=A0A8S0VAJ7_OLEEU|nr:Hypothetical predicted protein [Olea europaea subsp. europaea]